MGQSDGDVDQQNMQQVQQPVQGFYQNVVVVRHGERRDNIEPLWAAKASRPWDPPLTDDGKLGTFTVGRMFRTRFQFPIHRVFVSPFLRCLQTANGLVAALSAVDDDTTSLPSDQLTIDTSKIKISVEYGLSEMLNSVAIRSQVAPKDGDFGFDISKCEASLTAGAIDHSFERVYDKLPQWEETLECAHARYLHVIKTLADKYPSENLLLVTHGEGVGASFSEFKKGFIASSVDYCAYLHAKRPIFFDENQSFTSGDFSHVGHRGIIPIEAVPNAI